MGYMPLPCKTFSAMRRKMPAKPHSATLAAWRSLSGALWACGLALGSVSAMAQPAAALQAEQSAIPALAGADKPIAAPPVPDLTRFVEADLAAFERVCNAYLAEGILASIGRLATVPQLTHKAHPTIDPFRARAPSASGFDWNELASQHLGAADGVELGINHRLADSASFTTDVNLRHAAGPVDISVDIKGDRSLVAAAPVSVSYDSTAMMALSPALRMGVAAHGDLGKITALAPAGAQQAGPVLRLSLLGDKASLSTSAAYDFNVDPAGAAPGNRFHVDLGLNIKL